MARPTELTQKQMKFADLYITTGNATQSYIDAGYKAKERRHAEVNSNILLRNHKVQDYIKERNAESKNDRIADMKEIKELWTDILRDKNQNPKHRLKASEYIAKTNAAFIEKQITDVDATITVTLDNDLEDWAK